MLMVCKYNWQSQVGIYITVQLVRVKPECVPSSLMASISALLQPDSCPWLMTAAAIKRLRPKKDPPLMRTLSASASLAINYMADSDCTLHARCAMHLSAESIPGSEDTHCITMHEFQSWYDKPISCCQQLPSGIA